MALNRTVDYFAPHFALFIFLNCPFAPVRFLGRALCLLCFAGAVGGGVAAADFPSGRAASLGRNLSYSIADFDGDSEPDLASIQIGKTDLASTNYRIQLQLSAAGRQTFQIVAPKGGLEIASRDVNGDQALDLILTTWLGQPVAILLNDGHGNFSRVEPNAFPAAFSESGASLGSIADHATCAVGVPPQSREDLCPEKELFVHLRSRSRFPANPGVRFVSGAFLHSQLGRAPPSAGSHS